MDPLENIVLSLGAYSLWGNTAVEYLIALGVFFGSLILVKLVLLVVVSRLKNLAEKTETDVDDVLVGAIHGVKKLTYSLVALFIASRYLLMNELGYKVISALFVIAIAVEVVRVFQLFLVYGLKKFVSRGTASESIVHAGKVFGGIALWTVAFVFVLSNLGVNITSLIASLGIGGIAIALALQNILSDLFSSFSIYIDQPFQPGDFIVLGTDSGTVEKIGLKTTRLRTLRGEELIISNKELTTARVQNLKRMDRRRDVVTLGVTYETPKEKLEKIPGIIEEIIVKEDKVTFDRCHLLNFGPYSLDFELVYYVETREYVIYADIKQRIHLAIIQAFVKEGIEFAYPTQVQYRRQET
jgi:small-conductance mechanosensitive channel